MTDIPASIPSAPMSALNAIAEHAEHCAFAAAALPPTEKTLQWLGQQLVEIMDIAREGAGFPARNWNRESGIAQPEAQP